MKKADIQALRDVLRHVATSRQDIQTEVLRLDEMLRQLLNPNTNHEAQYYQAVVTDLTAANERLTEKNLSNSLALERLRNECQELRTIISICNLYLAAVDGRGMLDENDLLLDLTHRVNAYLETKKVAQ
jgi:hypothetical protein